MLEFKDFFIGGTWRAPAGDGTLEVTSPTTETVIGRVPRATKQDMAAAVSAARTAFDQGPWPHMPPAERSEIVLRAGEILERRADELSDLITNENGTIRSLNKGRVLPTFTYQCSLEVPVETERASFSGSRARIMREPSGVVAAIVPWNGAGSLGLTKVLPALISGCTVVLKPSPETPLDTYLLADAFSQAGLPTGVLNIVAAERDVSEELVRDRDVDVVSFTGSTEAGRRIAEICGTQLKRAHLELGGKSAAILLDDVDVAAAVPLLMAGGMLFNNGEACAAWTRVIVPESRHAEVVEAMQDYLSQVRTGDPFDPETQVGPLVSERQRERVEGYISLAQREGARVASGGRRPAGLSRGWFIEPTLLVDATNSMQSSREEIFGPVASVISYGPDEDPVEIANDSNYGLSGAVFTDDDERGLAVARRMRTGTVGVNAFAVDLAFPFGGYKESGLGRRHGPEAYNEFLETKSVSLRRSGATAASQGQEP